MDIAIFGAGIAGVMTAISLTRNGHRCRIYERNSSNSPLAAGMGFIVMPESLDCFAQYGIELTGQFSGAPLDRYYQRNAKGAIMFEQIMPSGTIGIRRRDLLAALMQALPDDNGIVFNAGLEHFEFDSSGNVTAARLTTGENVCADLYIAADGVRSKARQILHPGWETPQAKVLEIVGLVQNEQLAQWAQGKFNKFNACTGGIALGMLPVNADHIVWYMQFDATQFAPPEDNAMARRDFAYTMVGSWGDPVPDLISITDFSRVHVWRPVNADLVPDFYRRNLVLVGDAAHPLLPFTSQGVSSAIADAVVLSQALEEDTSLEDALAAYSIERRTQCLEYVTQGRSLTQRFLDPQAVSSDLLPIAK